MNFLMDNYGRVDVNFVKGSGAVLLDDKRKKYIDFGSGIGVCSLGHANKNLQKSSLNKLERFFTLQISIKSHRKKS